MDINEGEQRVHSDSQGQGAGTRCGAVLGVGEGLDKLLLDP